MQLLVTKEETFSRVESESTAWETQFTQYAYAFELCYNIQFPLDILPTSLTLYILCIDIVIGYTLTSPYCQSTAVEKKS